MLGPYGALLSVRGGPSFSSVGLLARMPISMTALGAVLLVAGETGRYGIAGVTAGVFALSFAVVSPQVSRLVDRYGQARVLRPTVLTYAVFGLAFILAVELSWPVWSWLVLAAVTGAAQPNIGSMIRARWMSVLEPDAPLRQTAFAFESVVDEIVFVIGPPLVTVLATAISPPVGFLTAVILGLVGGLILATLHDTEPAVEPRGSGRRAPRGLLDPGLIAVTVTYLAVGVVFGAMDVVVVAYAQEQGRVELSGLILAVYAAGSLIAGLVYGAITWRRSLSFRFVATTLAFGVAASGFLLVDSLLILAGFGLLAGLTIAPVLVSGISLVESRLPRSALTEGLSWTTAGLTAGVTLGSSLSGAAVDSWGAQDSFLVQAIGGGVTFVLAAAGYVFITRVDRRARRTVASDTSVDERGTR